MRWVGVVALVLAAQAMAGPVDPGGPGRFAVGVTRVDLVDAGRARTIRTEIWYPGAAAGTGAPFAKGRFPLIVFSHGNCGSRLNYEYLTRHLASHGFVVAAPDIRGFFAGDCQPGSYGTPRPDDPWTDLIYIRTAFHDAAGPLASFRRVLRGNRAGVGGHSLGGMFAQNALLRERRFAAAALLAPIPAIAAGQPVPRPRRGILVFGGTEDALLPYDPTQLGLFANLPPASFLMKVVDGTHSGFSDVDNSLEPAALARQQLITARYTTALFLRYVAGRRGAARYLTAADAQQFGDDLALTVRLRERAPSSSDSR